MAAEIQYVCHPDFGNFFQNSWNFCKILGICPDFRRKLPGFWKFFPKFLEISRDGGPKKPQWPTKKPQWPTQKPQWPTLKPKWMPAQTNMVAVTVAPVTVAPVMVVPGKNNFRLQLKKN